MTAPIVSSEEILRRVELAGGDTEILRQAGLMRSDYAWSTSRLAQREHHHSRRQWEKSHNCAVCAEVARAYYRARAKR